MFIYILLIIKEQKGMKKYHFMVFKSMGFSNFVPIKGKGLGMFGGVYMF